MPKWITDDGEMFAADEKELITRMRKTGLAPGDDDAEYMREVAKRVYAMTGKTIPTDDPVKFIAGLMAVGLVWRDE